MRILVFVSFLVSFIYLTNANDSKTAAARAWANERRRIVEGLTVDALSCIQKKLHPLSYIQAYNIKRTHNTNLKQINEHIETKLNPWKETESASTIQILEELETKIGDYALSMKDIVKSAAVLFQESEESLAEPFKKVMDSVITFYIELVDSLNEALSDENLFTNNDNQIETIQDERFFISYQFIFKMLSEIDICYDSYLQGRMLFEEETKKLIDNVGFMAVKAFENIDECMKTNEIKGVLDLNDADDNIKVAFNACIRFDFGTYLDTELVSEKLNLKTAFLENDNQLVICLKEKTSEASSKVLQNVEEFVGDINVLSNRYLPPVKLNASY